VIGTVGNTGKSTSPHLHFEILKDGKYLDPLKVMSLNTDRLPEPQEDQRSQDTTRKIVVEEMPVFLGNESHDFKKFIVDHMKYPEQARKEKISGKVYIRFSVDEKGEVTDIEVVRSAHPVLDAEAVRIIGSSPAWKPGRNEGQPVKVSFTLPIEFNLDGRGEEGTNTPPIVTVVEKENKKPPIFYVVEEMPQFQGSTDIAVFQKWIAGQLKYPEEAAAKKAEGRVIVSFTVTQTGNVSNVKILRGADPLLDEEAIRVISSSPEWKPGKQRGVPVDVAMNLPINFVLGAEKPSGAER
jgi:TonB family protein